MTERLHFHFSLSCIGEGNGNPLQCSCLENPRDGGAWWASVYGVEQSRTRLKRLSSSSSSNGCFSFPFGEIILEFNFVSFFLPLICSLRNLISDSMKAKITAYVIILALHINGFQIDLTMLQRDLKLSEKR